MITMKTTRILCLALAMLMALSLAPFEAAASNPTDSSVMIYQRNTDLIEPVFMPQIQPNGFLAPIDKINTARPPAGATAISNRAGLEAITNDLSGHYYLTANISLSGREWEPIGTWDNPFTGIFDGQGFTIDRMSVTGDRRYAGLFGYANDCEIKNIGLTNIDINVTMTGTSANIPAVGGICGEAGRNRLAQNREARAVISNCYTAGRITAVTGIQNSPVGGIVGNMMGIITDSYNTAVITMTGSSSARAGGICGRSNMGHISFCYNTGNIVVTAASGAGTTVGTVGGIVGVKEQHSSTVSHCYNTGNVSGASAGGIVGEMSTDMSVSNCYNTGNISGNGRAGGISGLASTNATVDNCFNTGNVHSSDSSSGIGRGLRNITNSYNKGNISASSDENSTVAAGISAGSSSINHTIYNCFNDGNVTAESSRNDATAGGITGSGGYMVYYSHNTGTITASAVSFGEAGGISAYRPSHIEFCYNTADVTATGNGARAAGIAGTISHSSSVRNSYNTGNITGATFPSARYSEDSAFVGGICGYFRDSASISHCYSTGNLTANGSTSSHLGGIAGEGSAERMSNSYWNEDRKLVYMGEELPHTFVLPNASNPRRAEKRGIDICLTAGHLNNPKKDTSTALKDSAMRAPASFAGFDFVKVWDIHATGAQANNPYPVLRPPEPTYTVTVLTPGHSSTSNYEQGKTGGGSYKRGETVEINALRYAYPKPGQSFIGWTVVGTALSTGVNLKDATERQTSFTMPSNSVTLIAVFGDPATTSLPSQPTPPAGPFDGAASWARE